ncbi:MAG: HlyD family efflux transporter periplasmic adaptor subunit [Parachlamydiaceae bacterium]|nr:HlyD family efflux transporter periplasmic adaptor subunit [Parachlamydiaceae bacterium]
MTAPQPNQQQISSKEALYALNLLTVINKLTLKTFSVKERNDLIFLILNDTIQVVRYDRAALWSFEYQSPKLLGVSGQSGAQSTTDIAKKWKNLVENITDSTVPQILNAELFSKGKEEWEAYTGAAPHPSVLWFPIMVNGKKKLGLWLERWNGGTWAPQEAEILNFLIQAYGLAWANFSPKFAIHKFRNRLLWALGLSALALLFLVRIPLRIVAPCEVIPKDPILVTAPLEDIVDSVKVKPGEQVKRGEILFEYDKRVALQTLKIAEDQVKVAQQDLTRSKTMAFTDEKALEEVTVLEAKLKKEEANLQLARYRASQLVVHSPLDGVTILENPDEWRGKPVKVGEKVLMVSDPKKTKVRLWIPEGDNVALDMNKPIEIFLNVTPTVTREAKLNFISNASSVTSQNLVAFMAEADWVKPQEDVRLGLKGSAILYGEKVTLFYWIMRKPWATFRNFIGF